jgi:hypothetical protein
MVIEEEQVQVDIFATVGFKANRNSDHLVSNERKIDRKLLVE